jgi:capsular polysaccharide export protein
VPGQVEDDASVRFGSPVVRRNIDLLRAARARNPASWIVYKPHPDVEAGLRPGRISSAESKGLADQVVDQGSILQLIEACDSVETMTSLAGFEALLRGRSVVAHGQPFYAGWGLTEDLCPIERRTRRLSLDELVAGALILHPDYLDPVSRLRCGPELLIDRIAAMQSEQPGPARRLQRFLLTGIGQARHAYLVGRARFGRRGGATSGSSR